MERRPLSRKSTNIKSVGYDEATLTLEIEFVGGGVYQYFGVPIGVYLGLTSAESAGRYFKVNINGSYKHKGPL